MVVIDQLLDKKCGVPVVEALDLCPELSRYLLTQNRLDLGNPNALLLYNQLILKELLGLEFSVPKGYLIPTICSRWEFVKYILNDSNRSNLTILEIGTGSSAILAMMFGCLENNVIATEINDGAYKSALENIERSNLTERIRLIKSEGDIITNIVYDLSNIDLIVCNPPQYDERYYHDHYGSSRGFKGKYKELVGGEVGHEFIMGLLSETRLQPNSPPVYFQLTLPKLQIELEKALLKENYSFTVIQKKLGTRLRLYYKVKHLE